MERSSAATMGFSRVAIVNRGEPAVRLIHAVDELRSMGEPLTTIALCSFAERHAMFVREADEMVVLRSDSAIPYLDYDALERALIESGADAAWVGWGFVAEHPDFADLCARLGIVFIGPPGEVMRRLGDKIGSKLLAEQVGAPVAPWSGGAIDTFDAAREHAERIGFPLLVKATSGGGGRGIRFVDHMDDLAEAFDRARAEAGRSFGDPTVFLERRLIGARHIEVQVAADVAGGVWALGVRDCSVQRRNQKVLEESPSPVLNPDQEVEVCTAAAELVRAAGYRNVGTVEFLYQPATGTFAFLEVNTRLQVEHPVTELTTGVDLVKLQLHLAAGRLLEGDPPRAVGHAIEARLNAEDPDRGFAPAPGVIDHLDFAHGPGIRVDTGVATGDVIPSDYDAMVAKVIAWGRDREEARARLIRALQRTSVSVRGGTTNKSFLVDLLQRSEVIEARADTAWLDRLTAGDGHVQTAHAQVAIIMAAIDSWTEEMALERSSFYTWSARGRPSTDPEPRRQVQCRYRGHGYEVGVGATRPDHFRISVDGAVVEAGVERGAHRSCRLWLGDRSYRVTSESDGVDRLVEVNGVSHRISQDSGGLVRAPAPALVVAVLATPGQRVAKGDTLVVLEAMKMENQVLAPVSGLVGEVHVGPNAQVVAGAPLVRLEPEDVDDSVAADSPRVDFGGLTTVRDVDDRQRCVAALVAMRWQVLGYDGDDDGALRAYRDARPAVDDADEDVLLAELAVVEAFADISSLGRNRRDDDPDSDEMHSPELYFHRYLRALDVEAEDLPESFRLKLVRALAQFGIHDLDHGPALERAAHDIFRAQQLAASNVHLVTEILRRPIMAATALPPVLSERLRTVLDLVIASTQVRHPVVGDLARSVRFRTFDEPIIEGQRAEVMAEMRFRLSRAGSAGGDGDGDDQIAALVRSPHPLVGLLADHRPGNSWATHAPLLEILTRRNYQIRDIERIDRHDDAGRPVLVVRYRRAEDDEVLYTVATLADAGELEPALGAVADHAARIETQGRIVADVYVSLDDDCRDAAELARRAQAALGSVALPAALDRVAVAASTADDTPAHSTFRRTPDSSWSEDVAMRGLHPMIAVRLGLSLYRDSFEMERLPSSRGAHLFRAVAREYPRDERIVATAEVHNVAPVRNADGELTNLAGLEHVYTACLDGLRRVQVERPDNRRLYWNRVMVYVWEPIDFDLAEAAGVVEALEPLGRGLGIEAVEFRVKLSDGNGGHEESVVQVTPQPGGRARMEVLAVPTTGVRTLDDYERRVVASRQRGAVYPYELVAAICGPDGTFVEHDIDGDGTLEPVDRPPGGNTAGLVAGTVTTPTARYPEGVRRVVLIGDPTKSLGSLAEAESRMVIGALDLAEREGIPVDWFALSSGARIAMDSGTENMDWIAAALRRIVRFTEAGGEINVVVTGINVGAQPYWNAEATMLQHTSGVLIMTPDSAMVLTGKQALDISGGVSAEDNYGIGGYDRVMGPNGQGQYWAPDLTAACQLLMEHHHFAYRAPGERFPRPGVSSDPADRDVRSYPHSASGSDFTTVGDIFSDIVNPGRKKPFDIRSLVHAVTDQDHRPLERWAAMRDAESAVVFDAMLGAVPVSLIGIESRSLNRTGSLPADGPHQWTAGTLFPLSSKKVARGINAASGSRPVVILANLSGFDGSPESLRHLQLEYGAEIGRAIVNFDGPIVFCVVSRYHGGAFVVFSRTLHDNLQVLAVEGTFASVLGGAPAAAVVFAGEVNRRVGADERITSIERRLSRASGSRRADLQAALAAAREEVRAEMIGEVAAEFDAVHSIERALAVGSVHEIVPPAELRPRLIAAVERGMARAARR